MGAVGTPSSAQGFLLLIAACSVSCTVPDCADFESQRIASPGGNYEVIVHRRDCGALDTGNRDHVELVAPGGKIGSGVELAWFNTTRSCPGRPSIEVEWDTAALELTIKYPSDSTVFAKNQYKDVMVRLRHCDARYPDDAQPGGPEM